MCARLGDEAIILIDEYDAPLRCALKYDYFERACEFFGRFFDTLRNNRNYTRACLAGLYLVNFSTSVMNNKDVYDVMRPEYSQYFGFTTAEVRQLLERHGDSGKRLERNLKRLQKWYNGYIIGSTERVATGQAVSGKEVIPVKVMNPYSIGRWVKDGKKKPERYWKGTGSVEEVLAGLSKVRSIGGFSALLMCLFKKKLANDDMPRANLISDDMPLPKLKLNNRDVTFTLSFLEKKAELWDEYKLMMFLVNAGYLTCQVLPDEQCEFSIPNLEVYLLLEQGYKEFMMGYPDNPVVDFARHLRNIDLDPSTHIVIESNLRDLVEYNPQYLYIG